MAANAVAPQSETITVAPVVVDLGKTKKSRIKDLKRGGGKLVNDVQYATNQVIAGLGDSAKGKVFVPVVLIYRQKSRRRNPFAI
jgi:hypothetical protein